METQDATVRKCDCRPGRSLSTEGARTGAGAPSGTAFYRNRVREPNPGARGLAGGEGRGGAAAFEGECRGRRGRRRGGGGDREGARRGVSHNCRSSPGTVVAQQDLNPCRHPECPKYQKAANKKAANTIGGVGLLGIR